MSKTEEATKVEETKVTETFSTEIVTSTGEVLPSYDDEMLDTEYLGYSTKSEDSLVPVLVILQDNSGEVKKKHAKYVEGAEPGNFIIRALQTIFGPGDDILFQPCGFTHDWVEWTGEPGGEGGAPVAMYDFEARPADAKEFEKANGGKEWRRTIEGNSNRLVETRHHFGNIVMGPDNIIPVVIPMSGTNHSVSRQWTAMMKNFRLPGRNVPAPAFARIYRLTTAFVQRGQQSWYKFRVADAGWVTDKNLLATGFEFAKSVAKRQVTASLDQSASEVVDDSADIPI